MSKTMKREITKLSKMRVNELQARFAEVTGETMTRAVILTLIPFHPDTSREEVISRRGETETLI